MRDVVTGALKMTGMKMTGMKMTDMKLTDMKCRTRFRCLNRSDDTEHCRMHSIVSETFDIS